MLDVDNLILSEFLLIGLPKQISKISNAALLMPSNVTRIRLTPLVTSVSRLFIHQVWTNILCIKILLYVYSWPSSNQKYSRIYYS